MTVKLSKFFSGSSTSTTTTAATANTPTMAPPLPPPNTSAFYNKNKFDFYAQQLQQQQMHYNAYMMDGEDVEEEEDTMSVYSQTPSIMTARDHPFNNSQRPLLAGSNHNNNNSKKAVIQQQKKKKNTNNNNNNGQAQIQQQQQQHLQHLQQQQQQQQSQQQHYTYHYQQQQQLQLQQPSSAKPYISPYVQQQKRDSAKGLHGFNDFDILSQQYTKHLQSPHIGYPYGSPPSPTVGSSDFVFEPMRTPGDNDQAAPRPNGWGGVKTSRFEDDFCTRRNEEFSKAAREDHTQQHGGGVGVGIGGGPFIFGVPPEQQLERMPTGGRGFNDDCLVSVINDSVDEKYAGQQGTMQSSSDTSSSSRDDSKSKKGSKFLLRKSKSKKSSKDKTKGKAEDNPTKTTKTTTTTNNKKPTIKCVLVGDGAVGKTNLIMSYLENRFNPEHIPTASDIYNADVMVNDSPVHLTLCDTAGQDTLDPLRELCYPDSNVFLLCFSVTKPETFEAIKTKWAPKFSKTKATLILVGTQADLRTNQKVLNKLQTNGEKPISYADAWDLATAIGAKYIETSSSTQEKVKDLFDTAIWDGLVPSSLPPTPPLWKKLLCLA